MTTVIIIIGLFVLAFFIYMYRLQAKIRKNPHGRRPSKDRHPDG